MEHRGDRKERRAGRSRGKGPAIARQTLSGKDGMQRFVSAAELGRGIWGKGIGKDEVVAG